MAKRKIVWFDITEIKGWDGHFTGIQRVVFSIGKEITAYKDIDVRLCRYDRRRKVFVSTGYEFVEPKYDQPSVKNSVDKKITIIDHVRKIIGTALPVPMKKWIKSVTSFNTWPFVSFNHPVVFSKSDTLIISGAFWTGSLRPLVDMTKSSRPTIFAIMYDMVPVIMPQFCTQVTVHDFKNEIKTAARVVDRWLSISENTKKDMLVYSDQHRLKINPESIDVIRLGSDINITGPIKSPFMTKNRPENFVLFVSTIEARKNQQLVYQAVKRADELGVSLPTIVLVGKHGWHSNDIASIFHRDKGLRGKIIWLEDADDRALRWLYKNCLFTVYPSVYEGWGLPVAESIAYGKFAIASNASSIPEVAGDLIEYFSPYSVDEFVEKVGYYYGNSNVLAARTKGLASFQQSSWVDTVDKLVKIIHS